MNKEDLYKQWKERRQEVIVPDHLSSRVMDRIHTFERDADVLGLSDYLLEIPEIVNRMMRYAAAVGLSLLGIYRIYSVMGNLLIP